MYPISFVRLYHMNVYISILSTYPILYRLKRINYYIHFHILSHLIPILFLPVLFSYDQILLQAVVPTAMRQGEVAAKLHHQASRTAVPCGAPVREVAKLKLVHQGLW